MASSSAHESIAVIRLLPAHEDNCVVVALSRITGEAKSKVFRLLLNAGGRPHGATPAQIAVVLERLGYEWSVRGTKEARRMTPREVSGKTWDGTWLVFTKDHVMPLVRGRVSNFNGCGDEPITFVMKVHRKDNALFLG